MATGTVVFCCSARRSSMVTCGRFLYFHQSLPLTPHFHLCTKSVFGPSVLSWRAELAAHPHRPLERRITGKKALADPPVGQSARQLWGARRKGGPAEGG